MPIKKVAILTAGGLAPCLSSAIGALIENYTRRAPEVEIICYKDGYKGLLLGDKYVVDAEARASSRTSSPSTAPTPACSSSMK